MTEEFAGSVDPGHRKCTAQLWQAIANGQAGALHVKAETETVVTEDEVSSKDGLRTRDGAPGYRARSITDGIDWRDPSETSGRSIAGSAAGLGFGKPGAIQGGGPGRAKRSPSSAREGPGGHDQATDCDRGCQRGRPHGATGRGTRRKRGGSRDSKQCPTTWRSLWPSANRTASTPMNAARRAVLQAHVVPCCLIAKNNSTSTSITSSNPAAVKRTSPDTENHEQNGYAKVYDDKYTFKTNVDNDNCDTTYTDKHKHNMRKV